jgi:aspartate aminotransferase-like enzyme
MDAWGMDLAISGSQKGLMLPPGLGFLAVGPKAQPRMKEAKLPRFYFNLALYEKALKDWDTPFTPATALVVALGEAIRRLEREGLERILRRSESLACYTRKRLDDLGFKLFAKSPSNAVTAVQTPSGIDGERLVEWIRQKEGISIAGGQGEMKGRIIRVAHMGYIRKADLDRGFAALKRALVQFKKGNT